HRLIVTSTAYRQSSRMWNAEFGMRNEDQRAATAVAGFGAVIPQSAIRNPHFEDPDNRLLARFPLRRLDAEGVRDAMLATSGRLNLKPFGPPVPVMEDDAGLIVIGKANRDGAQYKLGDESVPAGEESRPARRPAPAASGEAPARPAVPPKKGAKAPEPPSAEARALAAFCQALLSSNRFLYVD